MKDFKNNPEIVKNIRRFWDSGLGSAFGSTEIELSLVICVWNTSHLLGRSLECYAKQDLNKDLWELIIVDDNSEDDVLEVVQPYLDNPKFHIRYMRLEHNYGMRGNTCAFNTGFAWAQGRLLGESTPETLFPVEMMRKLYEPHLKHRDIFVAAKTYNLTKELQLAIDTVDWREDLGNIMLLPGFFNDWTLNNFKNTHFGTHQTCSIAKETFYRLFPNGYPLYCDYGSEDPKFLNLRERNGVRDITIMQPMAFHTWHSPWQYWSAKGKSPNTNKYGHSIKNVMGDTSGDVPEGGTRYVWDGGSDEMLSEQEIAEWNKFDDIVRATGCKVVP